MEEAEDSSVSKGLEAGVSSWAVGRQLVGESLCSISTTLELGGGDRNLASDSSLGGASLQLRW